MGKRTMLQSAGRDEVKRYLQQYHIARRKKKILEERHHVLASELSAHGSSSPYRTAPVSNGRKSDGAVSVAFRIAEVEERIEAQRDEMAKAVLHVMDMIDLLRADSMERTVVEMRHIDGKGWDQIAREVYLSRSAVFNHYNGALDHLLQCKRTKSLVAGYGGT